LLHATSSYTARLSNSRAPGVGRLLRYARNITITARQSLPFISFFPPP
jgi:hypothetical protein